VKFQLFGTPYSAGGAYVSPASIATNVSGRVATTVNSGTVSGVLQLIATLHRKTDGVDVVSAPVVITVNAGLPDQKFFTIGPDQHNFAGWDWVNRTDGILVQVGDKYSNPVKTGTAVYFNTTGGIIDASGFTDASGHAKVLLYSGNPLPQLPYNVVKYPPVIYGDSMKGYAWVRAFTIGQQEANVTDSTLMLFSGIAQITAVSVDSFHVLQSGSEGFSFTVSDENGNPLAPGQIITATLQYTAPPNSQVNLVTTGDVSVVLGDYLFRGPESTRFTVQVADQTQGGLGNRIGASVKIHTEGPNSTANTIVYGTIGG
jgi:hypothetical protein